MMPHNKRKRGSANRMWFLMAASALAVSVLFTLLNYLTPTDPLHHTEMIVYPYLRYGSLVGIGTLIVLTIFCLRLTVSAPTPRFIRAFGILMFCVGLLTASGAPALFSPAVQHRDSTDYAGQRYHLMRVAHSPQESNAYSVSFLLYQCDAHGILCRNIAEVYRNQWDEQVQWYEYGVAFNTGSGEKPLIEIIGANERTIIPLMNFVFDEAFE